jgi:hypothetical protein
MSTTTRSLLRFLPVAMLLLAITVHGVRIVTIEDDPQRGSAFAMFATVDIGATRRVVATVPPVTPGRPEVTLEIPDSLESDRAALAERPTDDAAREVAALLLDLDWEVDAGSGSVAPEPGTDDQSLEPAAPVDRVRIQVVGLDADGTTISRQVFTDVVVEGDQS